MTTPIPSPQIFSPPIRRKFHWISTSSDPPSKPKSIVGGLISLGIASGRGGVEMFVLIETNVLHVELCTKSFTELKLLIFICLFLPIFLVVAFQRRFRERRRGREASGSRKHEWRKKNKKKFRSCYDSISILGQATDFKANPGPQRGPIGLTIAEALGFITHAPNVGYDSDLGQEEGPNNRMTLGEALGPFDTSDDDSVVRDKKNRNGGKWMVSVKKAVSKFSVLSCANPTAGEGPAERSSGGKPLISLMKEMDRAEQRRKRKRASAARKEKKERGRNEGVCHVCTHRSKNATLVPCGHAYCRVCSREIWINTRSCPICNSQIVEVIDTF